MSSLLGGDAEPQGRLSGAGLPFSPNSILQLTDRAHSKLWSFHTTRLSPRGAQHQHQTAGAQKELKPKSKLCSSPKSLLPQGTSQRGAWDAGPPVTQREFSGNSQVTPAKKVKFPLCPQLTFYKENDADFQNHSCFWSTNCFPWHSCSIKRGRYNSYVHYPAARKKYSHQQSKKGVVHNNYLHFASPRVLSVHIYKLKDFFHPVSEVNKYSLHDFPYESSKIFKQILIHTC